MRSFTQANRVQTHTMITCPAMVTLAPILLHQITGFTIEEHVSKLTDDTNNCL